MKLVATSVVRGSYQGESHGGVYLIDLEKREVRQTIDWNKADIDWQGRGWDRGLRGIAFDGETIYIAASDELFAYTPDFQPLGSWQNPYLKHCHEISVWERRLFLTSTGFDSILGFDLDRREINWAMHVATHEFRFKAATFDPRGEDGPLMLNKLHVNNVHCTKGGMYLSGLRKAACSCSTVAKYKCRPNCRQVRTMRARFATAYCLTIPWRTPCVTPGVARASRTVPCASPVTIPPRSGTRIWTRVASPGRVLRAGSA